jgi:hypothetical protein
MKHTRMTRLIATSVLTLALAALAAATPSQTAATPSQTAAATNTSAAHVCAANETTNDRGNPKAVPPILPPAPCSGAAATRRAEAQQRQEFSYRLPSSARYNNAELSVFGSTGASSVPATIVHVTAPGNGFQWDDAGIGAAAALALIGIALVGTRAATSSRRHTRHQGATASS